MADASDSGVHGTGARLLTVHALWALLTRPHLWFDALLVVGRIARRAWWKRWPPVPTPDPEYLMWREQTHYGAEPETDTRRRAYDLVSYLEFCRSHRRAHR